MEKGFNDDELADIMSEIESLEQEFASDDAQAKVEPGIDEVAESVAALAQEEEESHEPEMVEESVAEAYESEMVQDEQEKSEPAMEEQEVEEAFEEPETFIAQEEVEPSSVVYPVAQEQEVLEQLSEMKVEDVVPEKSPESYDDNIHHMKIEETPMSKPSHSQKSGHTSMNFSVEGDMKLDLSFMIGHNEVKLHVTDQGLEIELEGGAKFSLPVSSPVESKKVA